MTVNAKAFFEHSKLITSLLFHKGRRNSSSLCVFEVLAFVGNIEFRSGGISRSAGRIIAAFRMHEIVTSRLSKAVVKTNPDFVERTPLRRAGRIIAE